MSINNLSSFLEEFKKKVQKQSTYTSNISDVLDKYTKTQPYSFSTQGDVLFIKASPSVKQYIFIHKKEILEEIHNKIHPQVFSDIK